MAEPPRHDPTLTWHGDRDDHSRVWAGMSEGSAPLARPGDRLAGRFELREALGAGGMGVVFLAFDLELEETVAVKLLHTEVHGYGSALGALRREVRAARAVVSPHVVRVFELHHDADATFLVMEYVDGSSLAARLASHGALSYEAALRLLVQVADGLAVTHSRGLVHRDVKPGNVLLRSDGSAVLADFGLSRGPTTGVTGRFVAAGTPAYMPPEQALGGALTPAADIFAFGVMAYELLAGSLPWTALSPMELALSKARTPPPPLTARAPRVSTALWGVLRPCLAFDPAARLQDGAALLEALRGLVPAQAPARVRSQPRAAAEAMLPLVWIRPIDIEGPDVPLADEREDIREEVQSELGTRRSIRVVEGASLAAIVRDGGCARTAALANGISFAVRCRLKLRGGLLHARVQVSRVETDVLVYSELVAFNEPVVAVVAQVVADHVARALSASERPAESAAGPEEGGADPSQAVVTLARRHLRTFDPALVDVAAALLAHVLARNPHDPELLALRACALARSWSLRGSLASTQAKELRALMTQLHGIDSEDGEVRFAHAVALLQTGDAVGAARRARLAIARQPSLPGAQAMLARLLAEADFLDEAERRLAIAERLDPELSDVDLTRTIITGLRSQMPEAARALNALGGRKDLRHARVFWAFRLAMWRQDPRAIEELLEHGLDEAEIHDDAPVRRALRIAGEIVLGRCAPGPVVGDLARRAPLDALHWLELEAEVLASVGAVDAALRSLAAALGHGSIALAWWRNCPQLELLRASPAGAAVSQRLEHRATRVYAAIRDARESH